MKDKEEVLARCKTEYEREHNIESVLLLLRENGYSKVQSIKTLIETLQIPIDEAKRVVHLSQAWRDRYHTDEKFHDLLEKSVVKRAARKGK